jgi:nucleoside-diphosphate-sugar epimerase
MHFQIPPNDQEKLVYCSNGRLLDIAIDLRIGSPTYLKVFSMELTHDRPLAIYLPKGVAHGFLSKSDNSIITYLTSVVHHPESDVGIKWNSIDYSWPCSDPIISDRDRDFLPLVDFKSPFYFSETVSLTPVKGRALITGASGFIGSRLTRRLIAEGWEVAAILRASSDVSELNGLKEKLTIYRIGEEYNQLSRIIAEFRPTHVYHTAARTFHDYKASQVNELLNANVRFGLELVEAMLAVGVRNLINTGTSWQHYEGADYSPVNLYAATKQAFESLLQYYIEARGLRVITLKLFDTFGENDPRPKLLNLLASAARTGIPLQLSAGDQVLDLVWVEDVIRAYMIAASLFNKEHGFHASYGLSGGNRMTLKQFLQLYNEATGEPALVSLGARPYREREVMVPWVSMERLPGWNPTPNAIRNFLEEHH